MQAAHRAHAEWTPSRLIPWANKTGPHTAAFVQQLLETRRHPEQGYRSCLGLMQLCRTYPAERVDAACRRALDIRALNYRSVKSILATGLDHDDSASQAWPRLSSNRPPSPTSPSSPSTIASACSSNARRPTGSSADVKVAATGTN